MGSNGKKTLVIRNGTLIDGSGKEPTQNDSVVIEANRIRSVGALPPDVNVEDKDNVQVIDASGQVVMPGLIDSHCHLSLRQPDLPGVTWPNSAEFSTLWSARNAQKVLRAGVTSICVTGGRWLADVNVRNAINAGLIEGPRIYCASRFLSTVGSIGDRIPPWDDTPDHSTSVMTPTVGEMIAEVRKQCKSGVDFIKIGDTVYGDGQVFFEEELSQIVQEAHRRGPRVAIHSRGSGSTRAAAKAGVDYILHADLATEADLEAVAEAGVCIMPTMTFMFNCLDYGSEIGVDQQEHDAIKRNVESCVTNMALAHKMGIKLLAGTDTGNSPITVHGESNLCEVELFRKHVGYSAMEAVMACTSDNAYAVGLEGEVGVIEAGKLADVIVLNGDPLSDIAVLQDPKKITTIIKDGKLVDRNASDMGLNIPPFELAEKHPTGTW